MIYGLILMAWVIDLIIIYPTYFIIKFLFLLEIAKWGDINGYPRPIGTGGEVFMPDKSPKDTLNRWMKLTK